MVAKNPTPEQNPAESMLQQAIEALRTEQFAKARDILTTLLQTDQKNPDYWIWMSATMETQKERLYCLQTAYKLDPTNIAARRGLAIMGSLPDGEPLQPFPMNHPRTWETKSKQVEVNERPKLTASPAFRLGAVIGLIMLVFIGTIIAIGISTQRPAATQAPAGTSRPTVTPYATNSNNAIPQVSTAKPLIEFLSTPYTPTPIYAATPHGEAAGDSYKGAMRAYRNGQWENVAIMMAQVATSQPGSADAIYFIAEAKRMSGDLTEAINYYKTAIDINPNFAPSYLGRARANLVLNPKNNIINDLNKAISLDPNYAEAYTERGLYFFRKNDLKSAQTDLEIASGLNKSPLVELTLARVLLAQGQNGAAVIAAKRANQMDVTMLESYLVLGMAYSADGQKEKAVDVLEAYLKYQPDNDQAFAILGGAYYGRGDYEKAKENLLQSLRLNANNSDSYFWLGQTYLALKDTEKALLNFLKARDLNPNSFDISEGLAKAYIAKGEYNNSYIAITKMEKAADTPATRARFLFIRAQSLEQLNQPDAAFRDWNEILSLPINSSTDEMLQIANAQIIKLGKPTTTITPAKKSTITPVSTTVAPATSKPSGTPIPTVTNSVSPGSTQKITLTATP